MDGLRNIFIPFFRLFQTEFTIYGVTLSYWDLMLVAMFVSLVGYGLYKLFGGD